MQDKKPKEQGEQVAVAMYKGEQLTGRKGFSYNEIYSLLHLSGVRELPKALDVLMPKLLNLQWVVKEGSNFALKFVGRDFVDQKLGQKEAG